MTKDDLSLRKKQIEEMITFSNQSYFFDGKRLPIESNNIVEIFHEYDCVTEYGNDINKKPYVNNKIDLKKGILLTQKPLYSNLFHSKDVEQLIREYLEKDLQYKFLTFKWKADCDINFQIAKELNFENNIITALINEYNKQYSFCYKIPLTFFRSFWMSWGIDEIEIIDDEKELSSNIQKLKPEVWIYSKTLDFKNDELFISGLYEMFIFHGIDISLNDIKNNPLDAIKQFNLLKY